MFSSQPFDMDAYEKRSEGPCFICEMLAGHPDYQHHLIYEDHAAIAFLNKYPTVYGYAERFVGSFKRAVADRRPYHTLGQFLRAAEAWVNFYNQERPHEGLSNLSPLQYAQQHHLQHIPYLTL